MRLDVYRRSRGTGLTGLPLVSVRRRLSWWVCLWGAVLLAGCTPARPYTQVYWSEPVGVVITTDGDLIERACWNAKRYGEGPSQGCYVPANPVSQAPMAIFYCPPQDAEICWHEYFDHHVRKFKH